MTEQSKKNIWSRHKVDIYQAIADGLPRNAEELRGALNDADAWSQEFELNWLDEASSWLSYDLINSVEHENAGQPELFPAASMLILATTSPPEMISG